MKHTAAILALLACSPSAIAQTPGFHLVGLPPGTTSSEVSALSQNGAVAAGWGLAPPPNFIIPGFTWTSGSGRNDFGLTAGLPAQTPAEAIDSDGDVVVGAMGSTILDYRAYRREGAGPLQDLGLLPGYQASRADAVSGDGATLAGTGYTQFMSGIRIGQAFRWTQQGGMQPLGFLSPSHFYSEASAISRDGSTIVGVSRLDSGASGAAFVWRQATGMQGLPPLPGVAPSGAAAAVTADGSVIVGSATNAAGFNRAVRWTSTGIEELGTVPGWMSSGGSAVSDDGLVIAGGLSVGTPNPASFIWTPATGMLEASQYLGLYGISVPAGWRMRQIQAVSGDGLTFAGLAESTAGPVVRQGFVVTVPTPSSLTLLFPALVFLRRRRG